MSPKERERFDRLLESVLKRLPPMVHDLLNDVPLHVEDYPSPKIMRALGVTRRDDLCGLYTGTALPQRSVDFPPVLPDVITIYREGITEAARDEDGQILAKNLKEEIRITILHELAHYHGIDEDELADLGYE